MRSAPHSCPQDGDNRHTSPQVPGGVQPLNHPAFKPTQNQPVLMVSLLLWELETQGVAAPLTYLDTHPEVPKVPKVG